MEIIGQNFRVGAPRHVYNTKLYMMLLEKFSLTDIDQLIGFGRVGQSIWIHYHMLNGQGGGVGVVLLPKVTF